MERRTQRRIVLASRPEGPPVEENFRLEETALEAPEDGQVLVRTLFLSLDPYMRGRMSDHASYARPVAIGELMVGGTVGQVVESRSPRFSVGDIVVGYGGWQEYFIANGNASGQNQLILVPTGEGSPPISTALGVAGMPGCTAYFGLLKLGAPKPGETLVVSAAAGAVGSVVGQIGKLLGCRVVGVAGGAAKCAYSVEELGFDACVDYKAEGALSDALKQACPDGIDVYFENVGGAVLRAVVPLLRPGSRVPICGFISQYNAATPSFPGEVLEQAPAKPFYRFFLVWEWPDEYTGAVAELQKWVAEGKLKYREDVVSGLENAPGAFQRLFRGDNFGKLLIKVAEPV